MAWWDLRPHFRLSNDILGMLDNVFSRASYCESHLTRIENS